MNMLYFALSLIERTHVSAILTACDDQYWLSPWIERYLEISERHPWVCLRGLFHTVVLTLPNVATA